MSTVNQAPVLTTAGNGMATTDFGSLSAQVRSIVLQADGKLVAAGYAQNTQVQGAFNSELVRYNADGSIDTTFGIGGIVSSGPSFATGSGVAIQADGKIVTAGAVFGSPNHFALARYNSDGSFDTSFGTGGKVVTDFGTTVPFGLMIQPDGKIVLAGGAGGDAFGLARFNSDGSFDTSFGTAGKVTTAFGGTYAAGYGIARTPDGKIVVGGIKEFVGTGFDYDFAVARYNDDGSLDTSFGTGGKVTTDFASTDDIPYTVAVQADGKIVLAGITDSGNASNFGIVRYNVDGSLDASFGSGGKVTTDFGANFEAGNSVTIQADGKIVVGGFSFLGSFNVDFALARYNSDGSLDTSFGTGGKVTTNFASNNESAISVVIQPDGKIVLAGSTNNGVAGTGADYALVRYNSDGSLDTSFGIVSPLGGAAFFTEGGAPTVLNARATVHDIDLDAAGSYAGASLMLARHGGANAQDVFGASGNLAALTEGGNIVLSGVAIGRVTQNSGGTLLLTFGADATEARVNEAMRGITYANNSDNPAASVQVDWSFSDGNTGAQGSGGALAAIGSTAVNIAGVNDVPVNVIAAQAATEDASAAITGLSVSDLDIGSANITVTLTVQHGTILVRDDVSGGLASPGIAHNGLASVTLTGDTAHVNATLASGITYRASPDYNGTDTLTMLSNDGGNTGSGGNKTDSDTVNIVVAPVNDAPSIALANNFGAIVRVSTDAAGIQGNGPGLPGNGVFTNVNAVFSPDGTKIAFYSEASNLVAGDTNGKGDIFVKNLLTGAITRVSTDAAGAQGGGVSQHPTFSPDGSKIAFDSSSANLVPGDNNGANDIFVKDLATGAITRTGGVTSSGSSSPVFSPDGSKIAFSSNAATLVAGDNNSAADIFIKDLTTGTITRVSTDAAGNERNAASVEVVFSPDGSKVAFSSIPTGSNGFLDIFVKDIATGQITQVSAAANGAQGNSSSSGPVFSPDGSKIAFFSTASNLVPGDSNGTGDVFVKDLVTSAITRVSTNAAGLQGNGGSFNPVVSPDGNKIAFFSDATNLVAGDINGRPDIFVKDLTTGAVVLVSTDHAGAQANQISLFPVFSPDSSKIAFYSFASNLVAGDSNGAADIFVKNLLPDPAAYTENASAVRVATTPVMVTDVDNATFGGGSLTAALTAGSHAGDNLTLIGSVTPGTGIEVSGSTVKYNGAAIGALSGGGTTALAVALNGNANAAAVQALAGAVGFASTSGDPTADTRTVTFTLVDGAGTANGGHDTGSFTQTVQVTLIDDNVPGSVSINDVTLVEGDSGSKLATFTVTRTGGGSAFDVNFATASGSASAIAGTGDYGGISGTLHFDAGVNTKTIPVTIYGDFRLEGNETFSVNLSGATNGATISDVQGLGTITNDDLYHFTPVTAQIHAFAPGPDGWSNDNKFPRELADVNGDGNADIVGFGGDGVFVALATGDGSFGPISFKLGEFGTEPGAGGWANDDKFPRELADVNGDGMADIVGFGGLGVYVALAKGGGSFGPVSFKLGEFGTEQSAGSWSSETKFPRELADVNGDGMADIVGFGGKGVYVALATGNGGFGPTSLKLGEFGTDLSAGSWSSDDKFPRQLADVNGDGMADIIGFGGKGVYVALATGGGSFGPTSLKLGEFGTDVSAGSWKSNDQFPRELADVNGDGKVDIVGFGGLGVYLALGNGDGSFKQPVADLQAFGSDASAGGWFSDDRFPRHIADVNHDGAADIIGFGYDGVYEALSSGFHLI